MSVKLKRCKKYSRLKAAGDETARKAHVLACNPCWAVNRYRLARKILRKAIRKSQMAK